MVTDEGVEYARYIQSPAWKRKRAAYFRATRLDRCQGCGDKEKLHVHHKTYERLGHENLTDLVVVCETCHALIHQRHRTSANLTLWRATDIVLNSIKRHGRSVNRRRHIEVGRTDPNSAVIAKMREQRAKPSAAAERRRNGL